MRHRWLVRLPSSVVVDQSIISLVLRAYFINNPLSLLICRLIALTEELLLKRSRAESLEHVTVSVMNNAPKLLFFFQSKIPAFLKKSMLLPHSKYQMLDLSGFESAWKWSQSPATRDMYDGTQKTDS